MQPSGETYSFAMQTQNDSWNIVELYASPYLVVNQQEYTKHIYAGSKRIVSKLAVGLESSILDLLNYTVEYDRSLLIDESVLNRKNSSQVLIPKVKIKQLPKIE